MKSGDQLMLEEAYQLILEGQFVEFYHATNKKYLESFKGGIRIDLSGTNHYGAGKDQGSGFYVFKYKRDAIRYATRINERDDDQVIVVIARHELRASEFDIDYEAHGNIALTYIRHLIDNNLIDLEEYKIKLTECKSLRTGIIGRWCNINGAGFDNLDNIGDTYGVQQATALSQFFQKLNQNQPELFNEFEAESLKKADTLKYNGGETIHPVRIEDLQGNVLWSRSD